MKHVKSLLHSDEFKEIEAVASAQNSRQPLESEEWCSAADATNEAPSKRTNTSHGCYNTYLSESKFWPAVKAARRIGPASATRSRHVGRRSKPLSLMYLWLRRLLPSTFELRL